MSAPTQFRKKPVVISAIQWTGENLVDVIHFTDGRPPNNKSSHAGMMWDQYADLVCKEGLKIFTMEGKMDASIGDWIIKGVKGEHYPCKPEIFAMTYEPADLTPPAADYVAGLGLKRIVEEIDGAMKHGTWRDEHGMRLKDTPEWVAFYNSLAARPASPDTRVVTMEQLRAWLEMTETPAKFANETETIRAIIGGQDRG